MLSKAPIKTYLSLFLASSLRKTPEFYSTYTGDQFQGCIFYFLQVLAWSTHYPKKWIKCKKITFPYGLLVTAQTVKRMYFPGLSFPEKRLVVFPCVFFCCCCFYFAGPPTAVLKFNLTIAPMNALLKPQWLFTRAVCVFNVRLKASWSDRGP